MVWGGLVCFGVVLGVSTVRTNPDRGDPAEMTRIPRTCVSIVTTVNSQNGERSRKQRTTPGNP